MGPGLVIIIAYLLGSIPFGYLIVRATQGADIRETGSGGTGATNVSRRAGKAAGAITLALDALKGAAAVVIAKALLGLPVVAGSGQIDPPWTYSDWWVAAASIAALLGHMFPVWLKFRGGKGVATGVGVFLMLAPMAVVLAAILFVLIVWRTRYISLGSIVAVGAMPILVLVHNAFIRPVTPLAPAMATSTVGAILIIFAHRGNIRRLVQATESKFR